MNTSLRKCHSRQRGGRRRGLDGSFVSFAGTVICIFASVGLGQAFSCGIAIAAQRGVRPSATVVAARGCGRLGVAARSGSRRLGEGCCDATDCRIGRWHRVSARMMATSPRDGDNHKADGGTDIYVDDGESFFLTSDRLLDHADSRLKARADGDDSTLTRGYKTSDSSPLPNNDLLSTDDAAATTRRLFMASTLLVAGATLGAVSPPAVSAAVVPFDLKWEASPINKRSGVTIYDAEKAGYNVRFVTYLSRFLLCFDAACQRWWYARASELPRMASAEEVDSLRLRQFGAFSASVEVGLREYRDPEGPKRLMSSLLSRYCPDPETLKKSREESGKAPLSSDAEARQQREIKEARRQIALLFGLMQVYQPVEEITKLLAAIDNGSISSVAIEDGGSGYAPGYGPPVVKFPPPAAGEDFETATGRAVLRPNGRILRVDVRNRGEGYSKPPTVTISEPRALLRARNATEKNTTEMCGATGKAFIYRDGANRGKVERIQLIDPGAGYTEGETIRVTLSSPGPASSSSPTITATATAILEYEVSKIELVSGGSGYAVERPLDVYVEPPPLTARVNMNDPLMAGIVSPDQPLPPTTIPNAKMKAKMPSLDDPMSVSARANMEASKGGGGGCIGRACYDRAVVATAYAKAEVDSYSTFREDGDAKTAQNVEVQVERRSAASMVKKQAKQVVVSGATSGTEEGRPQLPFWGGGPSSSAQLLSLLPSGVGLAYDTQFKRYKLVVDAKLLNSAVDGKSLSFKPIDPEFGPRGRSPIERDKNFDLATLLRFCASGAICSSGVHLALTPIDVVKTKVQTNPVKYTGVLSTFRQVLDEEGAPAFFNGWEPTFLGFFIWGGFSYSLTEFFRRYFTELAGADAGSYEVPIILGSALVGGFLGSFTIVPFESVRIRRVAQPDFADDSLGVLKRIVAEEGLLSLYSIIGVFLLKELPFATAKFTVFDLSTEWMYETFPAAKEDLQLSLLVSLAGGTLGGISAAIVSNPADATVSEMKKAKTDMTALDAATQILDRSGVAGLFKGVSIRMFFYSLVVSLQFLVYDSVRFALGIGSDDLKLYLDVLGGALKQSGGPV